MRRIYALLYSLTLISTCSVAKTGKNDTKHETEKKSLSTQRSASSKHITHEVKSGDSLYSIALKHHTTVAKIALANSLKKGEKLKIGRSLEVPQNTSSSEATRGSTLASAKKEPTNNHKKLDTKKTKEANKIALSKKTITVGSSEKKQNKSKENKESTKILSHMIKKGDSLYAIAKANHTSVEVLKRENHIQSVGGLKLGQVITIPRSSEASTTTKMRVVKNDEETGKITSSKKSSLQEIKIAKINTRTNTITTSSKKSSPEKLILEPESKKETFLSFFGSSTTTATSSKSSLKLIAAKQQLGKRYVLGAEGPFNFDCSGFTSYVCKANGVCVPRTSLDQSRVGKRVSRNELKPGDLIFFDTSRSERGYVNHVGIYLGNDKFIHASSAEQKVVISSLEKPFFKSRFKWGSRVKA